MISFNKAPLLLIDNETCKRKRFFRLVFCSWFGVLRSHARVTILKRLSCSQSVARTLFFLVKFGDPFFFSMISHSHKAQSALCCRYVMYALYIILSIKWLFQILENRQLRSSALSCAERRERRKSGAGCAQNHPIGKKRVIQF